jgi:hypothetical protein
MRSSRYFTLLAVLPLSFLVLAQGCSGVSTGVGACPLIVSDSGPADEAHCGAGPKQGSACCISAGGTCAATLPLCQSICCVSASDGGRVESGFFDEEGGVSTTEGGSFFEASTHRDSSTSSCPGNTRQMSDFVNATCQAALDQHCCSQLKACFNMVTSGGATDCNAYGACINACASQADPTTCQNDCDTATTTSVKNAYEAIVTCATNDPTTTAACQ